MKINGIIIVPASEVKVGKCPFCNVPGTGLWRHHIMSKPLDEAAFWGATEAAHKAHHRFNDTDSDESAEAFVRTYVAMLTLAPAWAQDIAQEQLRLIANMLRETLFGPDGPYPGQEHLFNPDAGGASA